MREKKKTDQKRVFDGTQTVVVNCGRMSCFEGPLSSHMHIILFSE